MPQCSGFALKKINFRSLETSEVCGADSDSRGLFPAHALDRFAHAQAIAKLGERLAVLLVGAVQVLAFGDELQAIVAANTVVLENANERRQIGGIDNQQLVFVELDLHGP